MTNLFIIFGAEPGAENGAVLPYDINEVWWGTAAFLIVTGLILWKAGPAIKEAWNGRIERIRDELAAAEAARGEGEAALADVQGRIADAGSERERILAEARDTAASLQEQLVAKARQDAEELTARATADIEASKTQVLADLQAEVASLALGAAEAVVSSNLDPATQTELIESYITKVGAQA